MTGAREYAAWRDAVSAEESPTEQNHEQLWGDFITSRWLESAREAVRREDFLHKARSAVLMRSPRTDREGPSSSVTPDAVVEDGYELLELLNESLP